MIASIGYDPPLTKPIRWAEHQVADVLWKWQYGFLPEGEVHVEAREALSKLSRHPRWWARLYVAEILKQHKEFRTDELIQTLSTDTDESVTAVIKFIVEEDTRPTK